MPWITGKKMTLHGKEYTRGAVVPQMVVDSIPPGRLGSLERLRMLQQVTPGQVETIVQATSTTTALLEREDGDFCPHCAAGPFKRLAQHVSQMHEGV